MTWLHRVLARLRSFVGLRAADARMEEEFRFHLQMETDKNVRAGMSPEEARRRALVAFGGVEWHKETMRAERGVRWLDDLRRDIRHATRSLRKSPGFTLVVVLTLALGIGANSALFSVVKTVLLDPLPYRAADRLVTMSPYAWTPAPIVLDVMRPGGSFEQVVAYYPQSFAVTHGEQPYQLEGARVTPNFFRALDARMALGRHFVAADAAYARTGAGRTAIISHGVWQDRYGASPDILGRTIEADGELYQIVGVLRRRFGQFLPRSEDPGLWIPFEVEPTNTDGLNEGINYSSPWPV